MKTICSIIKWLGKLLNTIRLIFVNLIFLAFFSLFVYTLVSIFDAASDDMDMLPTVKQALVLDIDGPIVEQSRYINPVDSISGSLLDKEMPHENVLYDIVSTLRIAAKDDSISGLVLNLGQMPETNLTKLRYIGKAISEFKATGKPIYAYGDFYNQSQYYLASYANKTFLSPDGTVLLKGYSAYNLYYKDLLENLKINTHIFRVGTYKSAVEPFIRNDMSDAAKESATAWLTQLWGAYVDDVAHNRNIKTKALNPSMDEFLAKMKSVNGDLAKLSLETGLVDQLMTRQQASKFMIEQFGKAKGGKYNQISYYDYQTQVAPPISDTTNEIAVVVASGTIVDGSQPPGSVGGDSTARLLAKARLNRDVKAVILRVDSPGGSAFASEIIRNEIEELKKAGKPVVVSMSSLAASGGYWISMSSDKIIAQPTTLTGSIGIFGVITTFENGLNEIGVHTDGIGTSPFSGVGVTNGLSKGASEAMQMGIEHGYSRFISLVGENRDMTTEEVDKIAQGRVWTGQDAQKNGLVDQIGDFDDAIDAAAELAKLKDYNLTWVSRPLTPAQQFITDLMQSANISMDSPLSKLIPDAFKPAAKQMAQSADLLQSFNDPKGYYAFCLNCQNM